MNDWLDNFPGLMHHQIAWERRHVALRMNKVGLTLKEIGERLGISKQRAAQLVTQGKRAGKAPIVRHLETMDYLGELAAVVRWHATSHSLPVVRHPPPVVVEAIAFEIGDAVLCPGGLVGMLAELSLTSNCLVQFGGGGPCHAYPWKQLRHASRSEYLAAGLDGVSMRIKR